MEGTSDKITVEQIETEEGPKQVVVINEEKHTVVDCGIENLNTYVVVEKQSTGQVRRRGLGPLVMEED